MATTFIEMASIIVSDTHLIDVTPDTYHFIYINHTHYLSLSLICHILSYIHTSFSICTSSSFYSSLLNTNILSCQHMYYYYYHLILAGWNILA